ncbi:ATP-binding protein [Streptomyces sp. SLBN-115]|uniref:ATP-binding protein n=1 Tax=Streptomyces sp. SLBN-115 TaxID=2768453 RepID=UPI001154F850|nr:ATP-binding protein [Streptomyces sp. SLBN-115]
MDDLRLVHLTYAGMGRPTASVEFDPALTVIYGASDTGKSFIVESIEYMLGGTRAPEVPEAEGYSQILLGLRLPGGGALTLLRAPHSNTIHIFRDDLRSLVTRLADTQVTAAHTARSKNSLSLFLLGELGLADLRIRKNEAGGSRGLALRDLVYLSVIPETRMVDPLSPVQHSSAASGKTAAASVVRLMLTGGSDPDIDTGLNAGQRRVNKGKITLLDQIILDLQSKLTTNENVRDLRDRRVRLQTSIDEHSTTLRVITDRHLTAVTARMRSAEELSATESRLAEVGDLVSRFGLLEEQYRSDLARLEMVTEAGSLLGYFRVGTCVFCGAEPEHQHPGHGEQETTQLHLAVQNETAKTNALLADLLPTIEDLRTQFDALSTRRSSLLQETARLDEEIAATEGKLAPLRERMEEHLHVRSEIERSLELHERIDELGDRRSRLDGETAGAGQRPAEYVPNRILSSFDETLRRTLEAWKVPSVEFAEYDQYAMDVRAGGRPRASRGKGVRSVLHSAFTIALAQFCLSNDRPHPGFVVLDSPVVTYRDPISDEPIGEDVDLTSHVVDHFYRDMLDFPGQAVIIENGDPPIDVLSEARSYRFTGTGPGRHGFFPVSAADG